MPPNQPTTIADAEKAALTWLVDVLKDGDIHQNESVKLEAARILLSALTKTPIPPKNS
jgi:hypothetical protein